MELSLAKAVFFFGDPISGSNEVVGSNSHRMVFLFAYSDFFSNPAIEKKNTS